MRRFVSSFVCLTMALLAVTEVNAQLDLLRTTGGALADASGPGPAVTGAAGATDSFVNDPDIALADSTVVPGADNVQGASAQATASAMEISGWFGTLAPIAGANATLVVVATGPATSGWVEAVLTMQAAELGAWTAGNVRFGAVSMDYQGGTGAVTIWAPGITGELVDLGTQLDIVQAVTANDQLQVSAVASAGIGAAGGSTSTNLSCTAFGTIYTGTPPSPNVIVPSRNGVVKPPLFY